MRTGASAAGAPSASSRWITSARSRMQFTIRRSPARWTRTGPLPMGTSRRRATARVAPGALLLHEVEPPAGPGAETSGGAHVGQLHRLGRAERAVPPAESGDRGGQLAGDVDR